MLGLLLTFAADLHAKADSPTREAKERLVLYQKETREALQRYGWQVARDQPGWLVATHLLGLGGANFGNPMPDSTMLAHLTIKFQARTVDHTDCTASIVSYTSIKSSYQVQRQWLGPMPFNTAESNKRIQRIMAEAETRLIKNHPEYASK